jgi:hypothetical protein
VLRLILHWLGADSGSGTAYLLWSGVVGDITIVAAMIGAPVLLFRKHNCEVRWCWRIARHDLTDQATGLTHQLCRRHHPDHPGRPLHTRDLQRTCHLYLGSRPGDG